MNMKNISDNFILIGPFVVIAANNSTMDTVWFMQISQNCIINGQATYHGIRYNMTLDI